MKQYDDDRTPQQIIRDVCYDLKRIDKGLLPKHFNGLNEEELIEIATWMETIIRDDEDERDESTD